MSMSNLPDLFTGRWKIVLKTKQDPINASNAFVDISPEAEIKVLNGEGLEILDFKNAHIDLQDGTLCSSNNDYGVRISLFRQGFYDTIFAVFEKSDGSGFMSSWCAQRISRLDYGGSPEIDDTHWSIVDTAGQNNAHGKIRIDKISTIVDNVGGNPNSKVFTFKNHIDNIIIENTRDGKLEPGPHVKESAVWKEGYGLSEYDIENRTWQVYDILSYDRGVRSFNSIFGYRSVEYFHGDGRGSRRVFATFNSELLRLISRLHRNVNPADSSKPKPVPQEEHSFGSMMSFEKGTPESDLGDPDIGIWVGQPLAP